MSRGIWLYMGARTRRSLTLLWAALFVLSIGMQYVSFAAPQSALAVHDEGLFELDGNAVNDTGVAGDDWNQVFSGSSNAAATEFVTDPIDQKTDDIFTGGGSKDDLNVNGGPGTGWKWTTGSVPDKDNITHAYAAAYPKDGHTIVYFGADRLANNGDAFIGFWFFKAGVGPVAGGDFSGQHEVGDLLVLSNFTNGGATSTIELYEWVGSGGSTNNTLNKLGTGVVCTGAPADDKACALTNQAEVDAPWTYTPKFGTDGKFPVESFFEGGIDLNQVFGGEPPCYAGFLAETRSSSSVDAVLKDFAFGDFDTCKPPKIATSVSTSTINVGESVTDTADLTDNAPLPTGTVDFYVCGPNASATACTSGGTKVGATKTLSSGKATSDPFTVTDPTKTGFYCFRADYKPDQAGSNHYVAGSHTNSTTECFKVLKAGIDITKTADAASVTAGDPIGFTLTIASIDEGTPKSVHVTDTLPSNAGLSWAINGGTGAAQCSINAGVLTCDFGDMPNGTNKTVHITSPTTPASCGAVDNTGSVTTSNDGSDSASASVTVNCPDVKVTKTPDGGTVQAGDDAVFTILVESLGPGIARNVTLTDTLPAGYTWTPVASAGSCSITSGVLNCSFGDLAAGQSRSVTLTARTGASDCSGIPNTASVASTNEPSNKLANNTDAGSIDIVCASIDITKTATPPGPVNAGDTIGFDIVVTNNGDGEARNVHVTDTLPTTAGTSWSISPAVPGCSIAAGVLTCDFGTMAAGASKTIHLTSPTTPASCSVVTNTASVTTSNDGSDASSASVTVLCPDVTVTKTAVPAGPVNAGDQIGFVVTISNIGQGTAYAATATDVLPAGVAWAIDGPANGWSLNAGTLSFGPADLAAGTSASVKVVGTTDAADCGTVVNNVTVSASNEANTSNNSASASVVVNCPDVTVLKTADVDPVSAGEVASFSIKVWNLGPGTAYGVSLNDPLPAGVAWALDAPVPGCSITSNTLSCTFAQLLPGEANAVTIHVSGETDLNDCGVLNNTATVVATNEPANKTGNNSSSDSITVNCPTLGITKTAVPAGPVSAGDPIGFEVTIKNTGAGTAFGVSVDDPLPAGFTWTLDASSDPGWSISAGHLVFGPASLSSGADSTALLTAATTPASCGVVNNVATIYQNQVKVGDDDASVVVDCPDVKVTKAADLASVDAGSQIGFTILVENLGPGLAKGVTLSDALPSGVAWSLSPAVTGCSISSGTLSCSFGDMAAGTSKLVHVVGMTDQADCGVVPNTAVVDATNEPNTDQYTANNTSSASVTVNCAVIDVTKTADAATVSAGEQIGFTVTLSNTGAGTATGLAFSDPLPAGPGVSWGLAAPVAGWSISGTAPSQSLVYSPTTLAAGASTSVHVVSATTKDSCKVYDNTASVSTTNDGSDSASASTEVRCAVIDVTKTADAATVVAGGQIGFTITVKNTGAGTATNVQATDTLPTQAGLSWSIATPVAGWSIGEGVLTFSAASLAPGASSSVHIVSPTTRASCAVIDNTASVTTANDGTDTASASTTVVCPTLTLEKSNDAPLVEIDPELPALPTLKEGETATFTLAYTLDKGPVTAGVLTDVLPAGLAYVVGSASSNDEFTFVGYDAATRTLKWTAPTVTKNGTLTYRATAETGAADLAQPLTNTATIDSAQTEPDSDTSDVFVPAEPEPVTSSPTPPPTDTIDSPQAATPGFTLMLVLLALAGFALTLGFVTPVPERVRRRDRDS